MPNAAECRDGPALWRPRFDEDALRGIPWLTDLFASWSGARSGGSSNCDHHSHHDPPLHDDQPRGGVQRGSHEAKAGSAVWGFAASATFVLGLYGRGCLAFVRMLGGEDVVLIFLQPR